MGSKISQAEILEAREKRAARQAKLIEKLGKTLICFTLNIAGPIKVFPLAEKTFAEGVRIVQDQLTCAGIKIIHMEVTVGPAGLEGYFSVDADPFEVKEIMMNIEHSSSLTRLFDLDVISPTGEKISRESLSGKLRSCLLCDNPAHICAGRGAHLPEEVIKRTIEIMTNYFQIQQANWIAGLAVRSLLYELSISPKPGLVDRFNNGAHLDMDFLTFIDSISVLQPAFFKMALAGLRSMNSLQDLMQEIRFWGREAEMAMRQATKGINTHKGIIFSLGIIAAAAGRLLQEEENLSPAKVGDYCKEMVKEVMITDFQQASTKRPLTRGIEQYLTFGLTGIRGEVASGFQSVQNYGLPALKKGFEAGLGLNEAGLYSLLNMIAVVNDTNIIGRAGIETQLEIQQILGEKLYGLPLEETFVLSLAKELDELFILRNISPGGSADLLSVTFMLYFLEEEQRNLLIEEKESITT